MRIVHLTTSHRWDDVRIFAKECVLLAKNSYDVRLIAPGPLGSIVCNSVLVRRVRQARSRRERFLAMPWRVTFAAIKEHPDLCHFHDPELLPFACILKCLGFRVIYDAHEDVPALVWDRSWVPGFLKPLVARVVDMSERLMSRCLDGVVAATPNIAVRFPQNKTVVVQNFPIQDEVWGCDEVYQERPLEIVYIGSMSEVRGVREMVRAMGFLDDLSVRLVLAGEIQPVRLKDELKVLPGWERVDHLGVIPRDALRKIVSRARAGLVLFHPYPNHMNAQPTKLFEYMSAGIPVIASDFPLWRKIVIANRCGILTDPRDPEAISRAIRWIITHPDEAADMGRNGRKAVQMLYNWETEGRKLLGFYRSLSD